jgi:3-oxoadipate CoA-transferase, alpha subunit
MIDEFVPAVAAALTGIEDGSVILLGDFAKGMPETLMEGVVGQGGRDLSLVAKSGGQDGGPIAELLRSGGVRKLVCSFVRAASVAGRSFADGKLELEIVPQGTLVETHLRGRGGRAGALPRKGSSCAIWLAG